MSSEDSPDDGYFLPELVEVKEEYFYQDEITSEEEKNNEEEEKESSEEETEKENQRRRRGRPSKSANTSIVTRARKNDISQQKQNTSAISDEMQTTHLHDIPSCWTERQCNNFKRINQWLLVKNGKLGCRSCMMVRNWQNVSNSEKGLRPPTAGWRNCSIAYCGRTIDTNRSSLRKKIFEHKNSKAHIHAVLLEQNMDRVQMDERLAEFKKQIDFDTLCQMFALVYDIAKQKRTYDEFVELCSSPDLQKLIDDNYLDAGKLFTAILDYIATQFRRFVCGQLISEGRKLAITLHESGMVDQKITFAIHLKIHDTSKRNVGILFFDLIGHRSPSSEEVVISLLNCLRKNNISRDYLKENLVGFFFQKRSQLIGFQSKFGHTLLQFFPKAIIRYSSSAKSELEIANLHNAIRAINLKDLFTTSVLANSMFLSTAGPNLERFDDPDFPLHWMHDEQPVLTKYILSRRTSIKREQKISNDMASEADANDDERLVIDLKAESNSQETGEDEIPDIADITMEQHNSSPYNPPTFVSTNSINVQPDNGTNIKRRKRSWRTTADNKLNDLDNDVIETIVQRVRDASDLYAINEDKDRLFLLSLLPFMKELDARENLEFRMEIQKLLRNKTRVGTSRKDQMTSK